MLHALTQAAHRLDTWLQATLGRPYRALLSVGLVIEIVHRLTEMPNHLKEASSLAWGGLIIAMNLALLINQLGEMSVRIAARGERGGRSRFGRRPQTDDLPSG
jgi:hypothetical protein